MNDDDEYLARTPEDADRLTSTPRRTFLANLGVASVATLAMTPILTHSPASSSIAAEQANDRTPFNPADSTEGNHTMPLIRIDAFEGRSESEIKTLLDSAHRATVKALHINEHDRYQIYEAHSKSHFVMEDTGLGIPRTDKALIITVVSKGRPEILKRRLYKEMTEELAKSASIAPSDVMICIVENGAADWSFGNGVPQFLSGDLG